MHGTVAAEARGRVAEAHLRGSDDTNNCGLLECLLYSRRLVGVLFGVGFGSLVQSGLCKVSLVIFWEF